MLSIELTKKYKSEDNINNKIVDVNKYTKKEISISLNCFNDYLTGKYCCMKCYNSLFDDLELSKKVLRELYVQRIVDNENILKIEEVLLPGNIYTFNAICYTTERIKSDLRIFRTKKSLLLYEIRGLMYQIINGINGLHKLGIIHKNLMPETIYVNKKNEIKIGEYGCSIINGESININYSSSISHWYKAPEVILEDKYSEKSDMWAIGCIFYELMTKTILFRGTNKSQQINVIKTIVPQSSPSSFPFKIIKTKKKETNKYNWKCQFPDLYNEAIDLLENLLTWDPEQRYTSEQALNHPFIKQFSLFNQKENCIYNLNKTHYTDSNLNIEEVKKKIIKEIAYYHPLIKNYI